MIGTLVQYLLYTLFWVAITLCLGGVVAVLAARRGHPVSLHGWLVGLSFLAGNAPYIGLFGTVFHIIEALSGIGSGHLNVAAIAQPIGQALYATLWGLGIAIPSVAAHSLIVMLAPQDDSAAEPSTTEEPTQ